MCFLLVFLHHVLAIKNNLPVPVYLMIPCNYCTNPELVAQIMKYSNRGGVEDTRLEAKAKDTKKIRGQGQHFRGQTLSRPRTGKLEAKAKDQGHSRKCSLKKNLQKSFSGDLQFIGVPRTIHWRRPKPQITCNDVIKIFPKRKFLWDKDIVGWKI